MRPLLRLVLLALGSVVMVATSVAGPHYGVRDLVVNLAPGRVDTVSMGASERTDRDTDAQLTPRVHLRGQPLPGREGQSARVVGILSEQGVRYEDYARLDPRATFTEGQEVEGFGRVAFVYEVPFDTRGADGKQKALALGSAQVQYLTLIPQGAGAVVDLAMSEEELKADCKCKSVEFGFEPVGGHSYPDAANPDGGVGDGG